VYSVNKYYIDAPMERMNAFVNMFPLVPALFQSVAFLSDCPSDCRPQ